LDKALPHPFFDGVEVNPLVITFETEGKKNVARSFRLATGKPRQHWVSDKWVRPAFNADDRHKTLTRRADYSPMTRKTGPKMPATKQRIK
jgi:hypothetical protein